MPRSRAIPLITDGENHGTTITSAIAAANRSGTRVYTGGAGTGEGAPVLDTDPVTGELNIRRPDGEPVITRLYEDALLQIAQEGDGLRRTCGRRERARVVGRRFRRSCRHDLGVRGDFTEA